MATTNNLFFLCSAVPSVWVEYWTPLSVSALQAWWILVFSGVPFTLFLLKKNKNANPNVIVLKKDRKYYYWQSSEVLQMSNTLERGFPMPNMVDSPHEIQCKPNLARSFFKILWPRQFGQNVPCWTEVPIYPHKWALSHIAWLKPSVARHRTTYLTCDPLFYSQSSKVLKSGLFEGLER